MPDEASGASDSLIIYIYYYTPTADQTLKVKCIGTTSSRFAVDNIAPVMIW